MCTGQDIHSVERFIILKCRSEKSHRHGEVLWIHGVVLEKRRGGITFRDREGSYRTLHPRLMTGFRVQLELISDRSLDADDEGEEPWSHTVGQ